MISPGVTKRALLTDSRVSKQHEVPRISVFFLLHGVLDILAEFTVCSSDEGLGIRTENFIDSAELQQRREIKDLNLVFSRFIPRRSICSFLRGYENFRLYLMRLTDLRVDSEYPQWRLGEDAF